MYSEKNIVEKLRETPDRLLMLKTKFTNA